jgi:hypothetical protein
MSVFNFLNKKMSCQLIPLETVANDDYE